MFKKTEGRPTSVVSTKRVPTPVENQRTRAISDRGGNGGRLTVGADIRLKGAAIEDCDTLFVEGRVEASMDSRLIQIAASGTFIGAAAVDEAEIHGRFDGDLTARERLVIHKTGRVSGTIRYGRLEIEEGGEIAGDIAAKGDDEPRQDAQPASRREQPVSPQSSAVPVGERATAAGQHR